MAKTKRKLTEDEKLRRRAARKAEERNQKLKDDTGPLFEHEIPKEEFTSANDEYWHKRWVAAQTDSFGITGGAGAAYLMQVDYRMNLWMIRNIARKHMAAHDFEICDSQRWTGDIMKFWRDVLTGSRKMTIGWDITRHGYKPCFRDKRPVCCGHGCRHCESVIIMYLEHTTMKPALEWPAEGWKAPLTPAEYDALTTIPEPKENESGAELDRYVSQLLARI